MTHPYTNETHLGSGRQIFRQIMSIFSPILLSSLVRSGNNLSQETQTVSTRLHTVKPIITIRIIMNTFLRFVPIFYPRSMKINRITSRGGRLDANFLYVKTAMGTLYCIIIISKTPVFADFHIVSRIL